MATDCNADESRNRKTNDGSGSSGTHEITVILLSGLPASGKSTLARKLRERFDRCNDGSGGGGGGDADSHRLIHIEYDDLEDDLLEETVRTRTANDDDNDSDNDNDTEEQRRDAWNRARQTAVERMEREIRAADGGKTVILMDDNFHLRSMRKQIHRRLLPGNHRPIRFGILRVDTPLEVCLARNRNRSGRRKVPDDVVSKMSSVWEPPRAAWEVDATLTIARHDSRSGGDGAGEFPGGSESELELERIAEFIEGCPEIVELPPDPVPRQREAEADRIRTLRSEVHALDKLLRSFVGRVAGFDKTLARAANSARKELLEDFRTGRIRFEAVDNRDGCVAGAFLDRVFPTNDDDDDNTPAAAATARTSNARAGDDPPSPRAPRSSSSRKPITPRSQLEEHLSRLTV